MNWCCSCIRRHKSCDCRGLAEEWSESMGVGRGGGGGSRDAVAPLVFVDLMINY